MNTAIRTKKGAGVAHLASTSGSTGPWWDTACGRTLSAPEVLPWAQTADEDRCKRCTKIAQEAQA